MDRISSTDLDNAFRGYVNARNRIELDTRGYSLMSGSKTNGQTFKIVQRGHNGNTFVVLHLGLTKRDSYDTLRSMTYAYNEIHTARTYGI